MKTIGIAVLIIVVLLGIAVATILIIASRLPAQHTASKSIRLKKKPADVYALVFDFASASSWRPDVKNVEMLDNIDGRIRYRENSSHGAVTYEVAENVSGEKIVTRIVDLDLGYSGSWTYQFEAIPEGTRMRITEDGTVSNLLFRFMARYVFGYTSTMESYLKAVAKRFGEDAIIEN
jgi:Polyketide cyclase / dehydrase and lipid transport